MEESLLGTEEVSEVGKFQKLGRVGEEGIKGDVKNYLGLDLRACEMTWKVWISCVFGPHWEGRAG